MLSVTSRHHDRSRRRRYPAHSARARHVPAAADETELTDRSSRATPHRRTQSDRPASVSRTSRRRCTRLSLCATRAALALAARRSGESPELLRWHRRSHTQQLSPPAAVSMHPGVPQLLKTPLSTLPRQGRNRAGSSSCATGSETRCENEPRAEPCAACLLPHNSFRVLASPSGPHRTLQDSPHATRTASVRCQLKSRTISSRPGMAWRHAQIPKSVTGLSAVPHLRLVRTHVTVPV